MKCISENDPAEVQISSIPNCLAFRGPLIFPPEPFGLKKKSFTLSTAVAEEF